MDIFTPTASFQHGPKEKNFPNISKIRFLNVKFAPFYMNSEKKCARLMMTPITRVTPDQFSFFSPPPEFFFRGECRALVFIVLRKILLRSSTFFPLSSSLALGTKKKQGTRPNSSREVKFMAPYRH